VFSAISLKHQLECLIPPLIDAKLGIPHRRQISAPVTSWPITKKVVKKHHLDVYKNVRSFEMIEIHEIAEP
jgi:hypothetical protein